MGANVIQQMATRQVPVTGQHRIGNRKKVSVPARLTWRDASGTLRFVSVVMRDVSDVDAFVECQVPASIPLYRLVHFQVERPVRDGELPAVLQEGKVLSAVYRVGPAQDLDRNADGLCAASAGRAEDRASVRVGRPEQQLAVAN